MKNQVDESQDQSIRTELQGIETMLKDVKRITDTAFKTPAVAQLGQIKIDLRDHKDEGDLIRLFSSIKGRDKGYYDAAAELFDADATFPAFTVDGGSVEDWKHDIRLRISIIRQKSTVDELNKLKAELEALLSDAEKRQNILEKMAKMKKSGGLLALNA